MKTQRNSTLEFFRVLLMLMVITLHYFYTGGILDKLELHNKNYLLSWLIEATCLVAVNCYVMLSAWFLCRKGATWRKCLSIFEQVLFYSISIYALLCITGFQRFNLMTLITRYLFPVSSGYDWFATVYIVYALLTPYINRLGEDLSQEEHKRLCIILFTAFSVIPTLLFFSIDNLGVNSGYSLLWFIFLHFLIMYIRKYNVKITKWKCALVFAVCVMASLTVKIFQQLILGNEYWDLYKYNSITTVVGSMALFLFFIQLPEHHNRLWCTLGSTTFGILLIHTQYTIRTEILWDVIIKPLDYINRSSATFLFHLFVSVIGIFITCCLIELGRQVLFKCIGLLYAKRTR